VPDDSEQSAGYATLSQLSPISAPKENQMNKDLFSKNPIILEGSVVNETKEGISLQIFPGAVVELSRDKYESLEEGTDHLTGKSFLRITLKDDAEIRAVFTPRLIKLAVSRDPSVMPFFLSEPLVGEGLDFPDALLMAAPTGPSGPGGTGIKPCGGSTGTTLVERNTRSRSVWGWTNDDKCLGD
jgi:hypothetical protein